MRKEGSKEIPKMEPFPNKESNEVRIPETLNKNHGKVQTLTVTT
jgi:hypothetical protein